MGRNNGCRKRLNHSKRSKKKGRSLKFQGKSRGLNWGDIYFYRTVANKIANNSEKTAAFLNCVLLVFPWAVLFAIGALVNPVYAQGTDVSTKLDTMVFVLGGVIVFILAVAFAIMLKGRGKK